MGRTPTRPWYTAEHLKADEEAPAGLDRFETPQGRPVMARKLACGQGSPGSAEQKGQRYDVPRLNPRDSL